MTKDKKKKLEIETAIQAEQIKNISSKVDDIHKILVGNGKPGLINEFNQWKGGIKILGWIIGSGSILGIVLHFIL